MSAFLIAESLNPEPGSTVLVGIQMTPKAGWHGYWSNPGDSGIAPSVIWVAPEGVSFGPLMHPAPTLLTANGVSSFVHEGPHVLLTRLTVGRAVARGTAIPVKAQLDWAACTATQCVPLRATLSLEMIAGSGSKSSAAPLLEAAQRRLPEKGPGSTFYDDGKRRHLLLPASLNINPGKVRFFPERNEDFSTAQGEALSEQGKLAIVGPVAGTAQSIRGVVTDNRRAWRISFRQSEPAPGTDRQDMDSIESSPVTAPAAKADAPLRPENRPQPGSAQGGAKSSSPSFRWRWIAVAAIFLGAAIYLVRRRRAPRR